MCCSACKCLAIFEGLKRMRAAAKPQDGRPSEVQKLARLEGRAIPTKRLLEVGKHLGLRKGLVRMRASHGGTEERARQCAGLLSRLALRHCRQNGINTEALLSKAGLSAERLKDKTAHIPIPRQIHFVALAADASEDDLLGFRLTTVLDLRELGWLYYITASANTLAEAMLRLNRYCRLNNEGVRMRVNVGSSPSVELQYSGFRRYSDIHQMSSFLGLILMLARHITAAPLTGTRIRTAHRIPRKAELQRLLACRVHDQTAIDEVRFSASAWSAPVVRADPYLHELCEQTCEAALARRRVLISGVRHEVEDVVAELLPHGPVHQHVVAERLCMSARTLTRRLAEEGCTFSGLLRDIRQGLAKEYLRDPALSVSEVAWLVGYSEVSAFSHAFQRWTGLSPMKMRVSFVEGAERH